MIYIKSFRNYEEFKEVFGVRETASGKARKNKILLACLKNKEFFARCVHDKDFRGFLRVRGMAVLRTVLLNLVSDMSIDRHGEEHVCRFMVSGQAFYFGLKGMQVDNHGFCEDGDKGAIRYYNTERERYFKMRAGKFLTRIMEGCGAAEVIPEQARVWLCEEFASSWQAYAEANMPASVVGFHYGDRLEDFEEIYNSSKQRGDFHSCMNDQDNSSMFTLTDAHAAWLTDADGKIFARCVVWDRVWDETTGEYLRLAERQYSDGVQDKFKRMLVDELIRRGLIDGYKQIGAGCHDQTAFVRNNGDSLSGDRLSIELNIASEDDAVSYMDSFVWYDYDAFRAYNHYFPNAIELDITSGHLPGEEMHPGQVWSDYSDTWLDEDGAVWVDRVNSYCDEDDCVQDANGDWQLTDDCVCCEKCGEYVLEDDAYYDEDDDLYFCDEDCFERWKEAHGYVKDYFGGEFIEAANAVAIKLYSICRESWVNTHTSPEKLEKIRACGLVHEVDGVIYVAPDEDKVAALPKPELEEA